MKKGIEEKWIQMAELCQALGLDSKSVGNPFLFHM